MIVISHPTGNANARNAALALCEAGLLTRFVTTISVPPGWANARSIPRLFRRWGRRRVFPEVLHGRTTTFPVRECLRLSLAPLRIPALTGRVGAPFSIDAVYRSLDRKTAGLLGRYPYARGVYCYEDGALETFRRAKSLGLKTIYELPTPYWRCKEEICRAEAMLQPEWAETLRSGNEPLEKLARKDEELRLADFVIVPSKFVAESLKLAPAVPGNLLVLPYGAPVNQAAGSSSESVSEDTNPGTPLRVIYVGNLGQAKGMSYLIQAAESLGSKIELTLIGRTLPGSPKKVVEFLCRHRHFPSLPHSDVLGQLRRHDVLVLPTLYDGFGLVLLEAMGQGLTVITTPNSGASVVVKDGEDGFIVPIRSPGAIAERLLFLGSDRDALARMKQAAWRKARDLTWDHYRSEFSVQMRAFMGIVQPDQAGSKAAGVD